MSTSKRIAINPKIMMGKPVISGTRITVELVLRKLAQGLSLADVVNEYPSITIDDVKATLSYAADAIAHEENFSIETAAVAET